MKNIYINGLSSISPQSNPEEGADFSLSNQYTSRFLTCIEPDYKQFINPIQIRRMSRIMKMGVSAGKMALADAGVELPDAIIVGTGLGCLDDTEKFLVQMIESNEMSSAPTSFISSTHNSVSAQIALQLKCLSYNFTYVHKGLSLISTIQDAIIKISGGDANSVLCGGIDEHVEVKFRHYDLLGWWKKEEVLNFQLYGSQTEGTISGEGAHFFVLSNAADSSTYCELSGIMQYHAQANASEISNQLYEFILSCDLLPGDIDLIISGVNGDIAADKYYHEVHHFINPQAGHIGFKHLCGTYYTADGFALWLGANILKTNSLPAETLPFSLPSGALKNILVYNHSFEQDHVMYLLKAI